ncbi:MAG: LOG family protein [Leptospirales bacterium]|jgi:uncharacterized protein (TIGR00730 family)
MRSSIYPYDNMITEDGFVWAVSKKNDSLQAVVVFEDVSQRFLDEMAEEPVDFIMRSRLCQLGLDCELTNIERPPGTTHRLEITVTLGHARGHGFAEAVLEFVSRNHDKVRLGKLFMLARKRRLVYEQVLQNVYTSSTPLIEVNELHKGPGDCIIIPVDHIEYEYYTKNLPNADQLRYLLNQGTRRDLDFFRHTHHRAVPLRVPPRGWVLSQMPLFRVREHFAYIAGLTLGGELVPELRHASARLFDPLSYNETNTRQMIEVFNTSDREVAFDGVAIEVYRPERRRCSIQIPATIRMSELIAPSSDLTGWMDRTLVGTSLANGKRVKHAAFIVDANELEKLEEIKYTTISDSTVRARDRGDLRLRDCPEFDILEEIHEGYIRANGFLLSYYFPRWDICSKIDMSCDKIAGLVFRKASQRNDPFFSEFDIARLKNFYNLGIRCLWLRQTLTTEYVMRDDCGFFMPSDLIERFQAATFFACYGSSAVVDEDTISQLPGFFKQLRELFGEIGVVTGGGPRLMEAVNRKAQEAGILSVSSALSTEFTENPQALNNFSDVFMYFDEYCRHVRQKNFSIARFPIFFPGGVGTLEEVGIELCNLKLGIHQNAPYIFVGTEYWKPIMDFLNQAVRHNMVGEKLLGNVHLVDSLEEAVNVYRGFILAPAQLR